MKKNEDDEDCIAYRDDMQNTRKLESLRIAFKVNFDSAVANNKKRLDPLRKAQTRRAETNPRHKQVMDEYHKYKKSHPDKSDSWIAWEIFKNNKPKYKDAEAVRAIINRQKKRHKQLIGK